MTSEKFPRIAHLPWSPGGTPDDRRLADVRTLLNRPVVITEKWDGSNVCLTRDAVYGRSHEGPPGHASFDALKARHAQIRHGIPAGLEVFGEWLWAKHSIHYKSLPDYLLIFALRTGGDWRSWAEVEAVAGRLGLTVATVLLRATFTSEAELRRATEDLAMPGLRPGCDQREGVVVRLADGFAGSAFAASIAKWVRADHVQTDSHWARQAIIRNEICPARGVVR